MEQSKNQSRKKCMATMIDIHFLRPLWCEVYGTV